ncbi:hypothetical protein ACWEV4_33505, partial [Streptomyces sp. NPDC003860]
VHRSGHCGSHWPPSCGSIEPPPLLVPEALMRTTPVTHAEADAWITVLHQRGHLRHVERGPDGAWTVRRTVTSRPWTLHYPALALDYAAEILRDLRRTAPETCR